MVTKAYNYYYTGTGNAGNLVNQLITQRGVITAVYMDLVYGPGAGASLVQVELSFTSAVQCNVHAANGPVAAIQGNAAFTAAGSVSFANHQLFSNMNIPANAGDVIYFNTVNAGGHTLYFRGIIYVLQ